MMYLVAALILILVIVVVVQIGRITEVAARLRGEEKTEKDGDELSAKLFLVFGVLFLVGSIGSCIYYAPYMLGYGTLKIASEHGVAISGVFNTTLLFTGIVFVFTHIALFWFTYKYRRREGRMGAFMSHDNKLELIWTIIPAVVMAVLVVSGLQVWNDALADVTEDDVPVGLVTGADNEYIEIGVTGMQFAWVLRHPGRDGLLGEKYYKNIDATNQVGQVWTDPKNIDDIILDELVIPVNTTIRPRITSRDVLHNFDIPYFYVKMDAVPGMPTYFNFKATMTTAEYREHLSQFDEWNEPADPEDPEGKKRWETFNFEIACAELCGTSHYSMRKIIKVVTAEEYNQWLDENESKSLYLTSIRGTDEDPFLNKKLLTVEKRISDRASKK